MVASDRIYEKNMKILKKISPHLADKIEETSVDERKYEIVPSRSGAPTIRVKQDNGGARFLHSSYDPRAEAEKIMANFDIDASPNFICLGFGLGYHIRTLIKKLKDNNQVFIIEQETAIFKLAMMTVDLSHVLRFPGLKMFIGQSLSELHCNLSMFQSNFLVYGINDLPLKGTNTDYYQSVLKIISDIIRNAEVNLTTYVTSVKRFYKNMFENIAEILFGGGVYNLKDKYQGVPAILISAGPSLEKNIHLLKKAKDKAVFIAVATSLKPLLAKRILPDFVIALDYNPISEKAFYGIDDMRNSILLFDPKVPHSIFRHFNGKKFVYQAPHFLMNFFARISEDKGVMNRALTVSHLAFFLARHMGCSPIIFTGQDLAFTGNCTHSKNTFYMNEYCEEISKWKTLKSIRQEKKENLRDNVWRKKYDIFGKEIDIMQNMLTYIQFFENEIMITKSKCIDATEGGAFINGTEVMPLKEVLHRYCTASRKKEAPANHRVHSNLDTDAIIKELIDKKNEFRNLEKICLEIKKTFYKKKQGMDIFFCKIEKLSGILNAQRENLKILEELNEKEVISRLQTNHLLHSRKKADKGETKKIKFERDVKYLNAIYEGCCYIQKMIDTALERIKTHQGYHQNSCKKKLLKNSA